MLKKLIYYTTEDFLPTFEIYFHFGLFLIKKSKKNLQCWFWQKQHVHKEHQLHDAINERCDKADKMTS